MEGEVVEIIVLMFILFVFWFLVFRLSFNIGEFGVGWELEVGMSS